MMRVALAALILLGAAPASAAELTLHAATHFTIDATVNGQPVRLRVEPEMSGFLVLNAAVALRIGLTPSMLGSQTRVGPIRLHGATRVAEVALGGVTHDRRIAWLNDIAVTADADGVISPADIPYDRVTFVLGAAQPGETETVLTMDYERSFGLFYPLTLGDRAFRFQFSLMKPRTLATAAAGAALATDYGGAWTGEAAESEIEWGVRRPLRPLHLARPLALQAFELRGVAVRTGDNRGDMSLPPEPDADPDEAVVTAASRQRARFYVHVGLDRLGQCSRLVWDNVARTLTLNCVNPER